LLETELGQTRANEAKLIRECQELRASLQNALDLLSQRDANDPSEASEVSPIGSEDIYQNLSRFEAVPQLLSPDSFSTFVPTEHLDDPLPSAKERRNTLWPTDISSRTRVCDMDEVTVAMEFVLK
jgi:hypothetical protein